MAALPGCGKRVNVDPPQLAKGSVTGFDPASEGEELQPLQSLGWLFQNTLWLAVVPELWLCRAPPVPVAEFPEKMSLLAVMSSIASIAPPLELATLPAKVSFVALTVKAPIAPPVPLDVLPEKVLSVAITSTGEPIAPPDAAELCVKVL